MKRENLLKIITLDELVVGEATRPDILHFFGQGNLFLSGKSQEILKTDIRGNHEHYYWQVLHLFDCR